MARLSRYVEFDEENYGCFSVEIARLLIAAAAEVDVICKQICKGLNPASKARNINRYRDEIVPLCPQMPQFEVLAPLYGLKLKPWVNWNRPDGVPDWWTAYNKTKHHRHTEYHRANLKNALNAVAGLYVACLYLYRDKATKGELVPTPRILRPCRERLSGINDSNFDQGLCYSL